MMELAEKLEALFADKAHWQATTFQTINEALLAVPHEQTLAANTNLIWYTPHFAIHWSDTGPNAPPYPNPSDYVKVVSDTLESAWNALSAYGYTMPNPSDFGGQPRFNVYIVRDVTACNIIPISAAGLSLPGNIQLTNNYSYTLPSASTPVTYSVAL
ncbi:MAG: hypothetical protein RMK99_15830, partial [Anaerolineales bacterium]|nr:hypothetical protein [Anaerolineales bacterium]